MEVVDESREMRLDDTIKERNAYKQMEEIFSIMQATEHLEAAFLGGAVTPAVYTDQCNALIGKFEQAVKIAVGAGTIKSIADFVAQFNVDLPAARKRLLEEKLPATAMHQFAREGGSGAGAEVAIALDIVERFITLMDALGMQPTVDNLLPMVQDLNQMINQYTGVAADWAGRDFVRNFMLNLRSMDSWAKLSDQDAANARMQVEAFYGELKHTAKLRAEGKLHAQS